ncbi:DMT family transporter [Pseudomonadota bacterium]
MNTNHPLLGILLMLAAMVFLPIKDGFGKILGATYSPLEIIWAQFFLVYVLLAPYIVWRYGARMLWPMPLGQQTVRGIFAVSGIGLFYWAVLLIPLASTTAVYFVAPLIVTALSPFFLGEKVGLRRWVAVIVGFSGVLLIVKPDVSGFNAGYIIALVGGVSIGGFYIWNRKLAGRAPPVVMLAHSVVIGAVLLTFVLPWFWTAPKQEDGLDIFWFIFFSLLGQVLLMAAFKYGEASVIAPFQYAAIVSATIFGFFVFAEFPDVWTWVGVAIVTASGIYIAVREGRVKADLESETSV